MPTRSLLTHTFSGFIGICIGATLTGAYLPLISGTEVATSPVRASSQPLLSSNDATRFATSNTPEGADRPSQVLADPKTAMDLATTTDITARANTTNSIPIKIQDFGTFTGHVAPGRPAVEAELAPTSEIGEPAPSPIGEIANENSINNSQTDLDWLPEPNSLDYGHLQVLQAKLHDPAFEREFDMDGFTRSDEFANLNVRQAIALKKEIMELIFAGKFRPPKMLPATSEPSQKN